MSWNWLTTLLEALRILTPKDDPPKPADQPKTGAGDAVGPSAPPALADAIPASSIVWHGTRTAAAFPAEYPLTVKIGGGKVTYQQELTSRVDPVDEVVSGRSMRFAGNPWVIVSLRGEWHAFTTEHLGYRQTQKPTKTINGSHIKYPSLIPPEWTPSPGQELYWCVGSNTRNPSRYDRQRAKTRTPIVRCDWPK